MAKYTIYIHTISGQSYIGYTSKSVGDRLYKHLMNAFSGIDTKFYRKIRKHGISGIVSKILDQCNDEGQAQELEKKYIKQFDSFKNGLNSTLGGEGGNIIKYLDKEKFEQFIKKCKSLSTGKNNGRYSGYTDEELVSKAVSFFLLEKKLILNHWFQFCKKNKLPQNYSKFRFNGNGRKGFINALKKALKDQRIPFQDKDFEYDKSNEDRRSNLSKAISGRKWYNDGKDNYMLFSTNETIKLKNLKKGLLKNVKN